VDDAVEDGDVPVALVQIGVVATAEQRLSHESSGPGVGGVFGGPVLLPLPVRREWLVGV
jgi:hypothetical protein